MLALNIGCEPDVRDETEIFEEAELLYRIGDYDAAGELYEDFLEAYPRSPFARTAKLRLRTIEREVEAVMGARGGNRPIYVRPSRDPAEGPQKPPSLNDPRAQPNGPSGTFGQHTEDLARP